MKEHIDVAKDFIDFISDNSSLIFPVPKRPWQ